MHSSLDQHVKMGKSCIPHNSDDVIKFLTWFHSHKPFAVSNSRLFSLSSDITASEGDGVISDTADIVGSHYAEALAHINRKGIVVTENCQLKQRSV